MYDELVKRLRYLAKVYSICDNENTNEYRLAIEAADAIEKLMRFAHFVAREVVVSDEEWESNECAFPEIASRKLHKIGIVEKYGAFWHYEPPKEETA